jgi:hypothetical protein
MSKPKKAKSSFQPKLQKVPRIAENVDSLNSLTFKWRAVARYIDYNHEEWGWGQVTIQEFFQNLLPRLQSYETMTWNDMFQRKSCHSMEVNKICGKAQQRISKMLPDIDTLHQIDMNQLCRLWGYRDRQILYLIWHDPHHTVYPV